LTVDSLSRCGVDKAQVYFVFKKQCFNCANFLCQLVVKYNFQFLLAYG
jgi:hypothetical protein